MQPILADLLTLLKLERIEDNIFRGQSRDLGTDRVFGGQVLGQALMAASYTVEDQRCVHSLHAYFLRAGDQSLPIIYEVDRARDGRSFSSRRVVAIQHGRSIFNLSASFQIPEAGFEHQADMPDVPPPDALADVREIPREVLARVPEKVQRFLFDGQPFDIRPVEPLQLIDPVPTAPVRHAWIRAISKLPAEPLLHRTLLAYISDYQLVATATLPHAVNYLGGELQLASLDHAMWFHREFRMDEWLLYAMESPNASGARGLALGKFYTADGRLVASTAQEGVIRSWAPQGKV